MPNLLSLKPKPGEIWQRKEPQFTEIFRIIDNEKAMYLTYTLNSTNAVINKNMEMSLDTIYGGTNSWSKIKEAKSEPWKKFNRIAILGD